MRTCTPVGSFVLAVVLGACTNGARPVPDLGIDAFTPPHDSGIPPMDAGTDSGPPACEGTQPACALLATADRCATVEGCAWTQCVGFAISCAMQGTSADCATLVGCHWSGTSCDGAPAACGTFTADTACRAQLGCAWSTHGAACRGAATDCRTYDAASCTSHAGCRPYTPPVDAGPPDFGPPPECTTDGGTPADAGASDAGASDAGATCIPPSPPSPYPGCNTDVGVECDGDWSGTNPRTSTAYCTPTCAATECCSPRDGRFQCVARHADGTCPAADVFIDATHIAGMYTIEHDVFAADACTAFEGCIAATGDRRLLRFDSWTPNIGEADLYLGDVPGSGVSDPTFSWSTCHMHHHFNTYAQYELISSSACCVAATGHKQAFCLIDLDRYDTSIGSASAVYNCGYQGIQRGYQDVYSSGLDCQWIDITDVPAGDYWLRIRVNVEHILNESNYANNESWVAITIP